jgi:exodeoxyribonuclease V alpha subunit
VALRLASSGEVVNAKGNTGGLKAGDSLVFDGAWEDSPRFGRQIQMNRYSVVVAADAEGIVGFLESRLPGIGRNRAMAIVAAFGADRVFEVIEKAPERLAEISGITPRMAEEIARAYAEERQRRDVTVALKAIQLSDHAIDVLATKYGWDRVVGVLRGDPYLLATEVHGYGFKTADQIALRVGFAPDSVGRARAALTYMLDVVARGEGHVYARRELFIATTSREAAGLSRKVAEEALDALVDEGKVIAEGERIYMADLHAAEVACAREIRRLTCR